MFKGMGGLGNVANVLKEAGKMKARMEALQGELAAMSVEGSSGGGVVKVKANGLQEILSVEIDDEVCRAADKAMLQDLVAAAANAALSSSRALARDEMAKITAGLNLDIPGLT